MRQHVPRQLGDRAGHLDPSRAAADQHEGQQPRLLLHAADCGLLERLKDLAAERQRVVEGLQPWGGLRPIAVPEITGL